MKIAYVYDGIYPYTFGGVEKRIWELASRLAQRGHEVHIIAPKFWAGETCYKKEGVFIQGVCEPSRKRYIDGKRSVGWPLVFAVKVLPALLKERFDVIDCQNLPYFPCFSARVASVIRRSPLVITWIEVWGEHWFEYLGKKGIFGKFIEEKAAGLNSNSISISKTTASRLAQITRKGRYVATIPIGLDLEEIWEVEPSAQASDVIFSGRIVKNKNIDVLVESISLLKKEYPDISAVIIGNGPEAESVKKLAADLGVDDNIRFTGFLDSYDELISNLKSSKVFVLPSTREGFSISVIEANACGLPVIVVRDPQNAACELVTDDLNGFICEFSAFDMAQKIKMLLNKRDSDISNKCIKNSSKYDWATVVASVEGFYNSLNTLKG